MEKEKIYATFVQDLKRYLQFHEQIGISHYPLSEPLKRFLEQDNRLQVKHQRKDVSVDAVCKIENQNQLTAQEPRRPGSLEAIRCQLGACRRCTLSEKRTSIVFGEGNAKAKLLIVGDYPDQDDDGEGRPFSGENGKLLDRMLQAIGLSREEVYLTNSVKCMPPPGRMPSKGEIGTCLPFLRDQIRVIDPMVICTMGPLSSQTLLDSAKSLFKLRGRLYSVKRSEHHADLPSLLFGKTRGDEAAGMGGPAEYSTKIGRDLKRNH